MATFGEISKIVASMWDSLSEEAKQVKILPSFEKLLKYTSCYDNFCNIRSNYG